MQLLVISQFCSQEYDKALKYTKGILAVEPKNHQASNLKDHIEKKMKNGNPYPCWNCVNSNLFLLWVTLQGLNFFASKALAML